MWDSIVFVLGWSCPVLYCIVTCYYSATNYTEAYPVNSDVEIILLTNMQKK